MLFRLNVVVVLKAVGRQHLLHFLVRTRGDLVNHGPGEGNLLLVLQIVQEGFGHQRIGHPTLCIGHYAGLHLISVVGAVVHALDGERELSGLPALIEQRAHLSHGKDGLQAAGQIGLVEAVALFRDGEGNHLQGRVAENLHQARPVPGELRVCLKGLRNAADDLFADGPVGAKAHREREVVVGGIGLVNYLEIEGFGHNHASVVLPGVEGVVEDGSREGPEDIAAAKVHPGGLQGGFFT